MKKAKTPQEHLNLAAGILSEAVYGMCRQVLKNSQSEKGADPKFLKEVGAALKEAAAVVSCLEKKDTDNKDIVRIVFDVEEGSWE